jgi:hypothetical protein
MFTYTCRLTDSFRNFGSTCRVNLRTRNTHNLLFSLIRLPSDPSQITPAVSHDSLVGATHIGTCTYTLRHSTVCHHPRDPFQIFHVRTLRCTKPLTCSSTSRSHQEAAQTKPCGPTLGQGQAPVYEYGGNRMLFHLRQKGWGKQKSCPLLAFLSNHSGSATFP